MPKGEVLLRRHIFCVRYRLKLLQYYFKAMLPSKKAITSNAFYRLGVSGDNIKTSIERLARTDLN